MSWPRVVGAVVVGLGIGVGSAFWVLGNGELLGDEEYDHWFGNDRAGSVAADPYTRGIVASIGLLALNKSETIYFHRYKDEHGRQLREGCSYELSGGSLPTRWWSLTVYAADHFLPVNDDRSFSVDASQITAASDGSWTLRIATERADAANWISSEAAGEFSLALRMYNPEAVALADAAAIPFPRVTTLACDGGAS
ncbi:MAG TPA: DUF1214 domain-containing protein [Nannocystaceae bacterium]|nr:DUF1214 domain-containing protein [Nannocystaceae bacterium]